MISLGVNSPLRVSSKKNGSQSGEGRRYLLLDQYQLIMATYGEYYFKVLQRTSNDYLGLHNLVNLDQLQRKIICYKQYATKPHEYYQCFRDIEIQCESEASILTKDYNQIEEEFKLCSQGCKQLSDVQSKACNSACGQTFGKSIKILYDNYYRRRVGSRKEYKKVRS